MAMLTLGDELLCCWESRKSFQTRSILSNECGSAVSARRCAGCFERTDEKPPRKHGSRISAAKLPSPTFSAPTSLNYCTLLPLLQRYYPAPARTALQLQEAPRIGIELAVGCSLLQLHPNPSHAASSHFAFFRLLPCVDPPLLDNIEWSRQPYPSPLIAACTTLKIHRRSARKSSRAICYPRARWHASIAQSFEYDPWIVDGSLAQA